MAAAPLRRWTASGARHRQSATAVTTTLTDCAPSALTRQYFGILWSSGESGAIQFDRFALSFRPLSLLMYADAC